MRLTNGTSSGAGEPIERDKPWRTKGWRSVRPRGNRPQRPPTAIQFSGAISQKETSGGGLFGCGGDERAPQTETGAMNGFGSHVHG